jgi:hypothetical protein
MEQRVLLSTMAMTNGGSPPLSCREWTSYGRMFDEEITDYVKIQASYQPCKSLRFEQERKQSWNTSIVMESSAQKACLHRGAFYLRSSLAGSSTGFVVSDKQVWGRPVGVAVGRDGSLFVTEDGNGTIWRISRTRSVRSKIGRNLNYWALWAGYKF